MSSHASCCSVVSWSRACATSDASDQVSVERADVMSGAGVRCGPIDRLEQPPPTDDDTTAETDRTGKFAGTRQRVRGPARDAEHLRGRLDRHGARLLCRACHLLALLVPR